MTAERKPTLGLTTSEITESQSLKAIFLQYFSHLQQVNSGERQNLYKKIIVEACKYPECLNILVPAFVRGEFKQYGYAITAFEKIITSKDFINSLIVKRQVPSTELLEILLSSSPEATPFKRLLVIYLDIPRMILMSPDIPKLLTLPSEPEFAKNSFMVAKDFSLEFARILLETAVNSRASQQLDLIPFVDLLTYAADKQRYQQSFLSFLYVVSLEGSDIVRAQEAGALLAIFSDWEKNIGIVSNEDLHSRRSSTVAGFRLNISPEEQSRRDVMNAYFLKLKAGIDSFLNNPEQVLHPFFLIAPRTLAVNEAYDIFMDAQKERALSRASVLISFTFPDQGRLGIVGKVGNFDHAQMDDVIFPQIHRYFQEMAPELVEPILLVTEAPFHPYFVEANTPRLDLEKVTAQLEKNRLEAAAGMSTISGRGDMALMQPINAKGDEYLRSVGIQSVTLFRTEDGVRCFIHWFNVQVEFFINTSYELVGLDTISPEVKAWVENLLLSYIAGIKKNLSETDKKVTPKEGAGAPIAFNGRRPHLRVQAFGKQSRQIDNEAAERFMIDNFGFTLYAINRIFTAVQDNISDIKNEDLELWMQLCDEAVPPEFQIRTNAASLKSMLIEVIRRTTHRDAKVQYSRKGLQRGDKAEPSSLAPTEGRFTITLVSESSSEDLDVEPNQFLLPEVGEQLLELSQDLPQ